MRKLLLLLPLLTLGYCKDPVENDPFDTYDRQAMLQNIGQNVIIPAFRDFSQKSKSLQIACESFAANPSESGLQMAQSSWKEAISAWKHCEFYQFGELDMSHEKLLWAISSTTPVQNWSHTPHPVYTPAQPAKTTELEQALNTGSVINDAYVESVPFYIKGLPAIEYLLFDPARTDAEIVSQFLGAENEKRGQYLAALSENVTIKAEGIVNEWESGYLSTFITQDGRDVGSSLGMFCNAVLFQVEMIKNERLGRPLGKLDLGNAQPGKVEAPYSKISRQLILENIAALKTAFTGGSGQGLDDLLDHLDAKYDNTPLASITITQFDVLKAAVESIPDPLETAVMQNPAEVENAFNEAKKLVKLLKVDMFNNLGTVITYTDNDGD
ncbi:MAG: imelysin family protein [Bacteroidota bacterium]|nr:imelysin family protein [Bacteroidota bacterium]